MKRRLWIAILLGCFAARGECRAQDNGLFSWWTFSSDRKQGASIKARKGGPDITPTGDYRFASEPSPARIELPGRDERLLVAESIAKAPLPKRAITIEAWVRIDQTQDWGGILSAIQDNGDFERGVILGFRKDHFCFGLATESAGRLTYLDSKAPFAKGLWHQVAGTYDGRTQRLFVNGRMEAESVQQSGQIWYAPSGSIVAGAYLDDDEFYPLKGALQEIRVYQIALTPDEIAARFEKRKTEFPAPAPEPARLELAYGPFIDWIDRTSATVTWETDSAIATKLELFDPLGTLASYGGQTPAHRHSVIVTNLERNSEYRFRLRAPNLGDREHATRRYIFDTSFNYQPASVPSPAEKLRNSPAGDAEIARRILATSGIKQGWGVVLGAIDGRLALELIRQSDLKIVILEADEERIAVVRGLLDAAGVYGVRASVQHVTSAELPLGGFIANLVVSESGLQSGHPPRWSSKEVHRLVRPAGGTVVLGTPAREGLAKPDPAVWDRWLEGSELRTARRESENGVWITYRRERLAGAGDWTHQYGNADNTSTSMDELVKGDVQVSWWGDPGPRPMPDRGPRNPAPLSVNGRLFIQGDRILFGVDAYNGAILWSVIAPEVRRANLPRDCSNMAADQDTLYIAHGRYCLEFDGQTGARYKRSAVPDDPAGLNFDWGFLSVAGDQIIGSRVKRDSRYQGDDGEWYEDYHQDQVSRVTSEALFGLDRKEGSRRWIYRGGAILNSTITLGDGMIFFIESRNPAAIQAGTGRLPPDLLTDQHLVALDLRTGSKLWDKPADFSKLQFMTYLVYSQNTLVVTGTDKDKNFHTFAFNAPAKGGQPGESPRLIIGGQELWSESHKEHKGHHSGHLQHPVVVDGVFYSDQRAFDLKTGKTLRTDLPSRRGCGTMSAGRHALFFRNYFHSMWDLESNKRTQFEGIRGGCWLGLIPAGGMLLAPESSAGCSCTHSIQTSVGYIPKALTKR